jgi:hypothetical protein
MQRVTRSSLTALLLCVPIVAPAAEPEKAAKSPVSAVIETTLKSASGQIAQFAFDGDADRYFASAENTKADDHFTLTFDKPVAIKSVVVTTGRPKGGDRLDAGALEGSVDGKKFEALANFSEGVATAKLKGKQLLAVRVKPGADLKQPLVIREIVIESDPAVATFKYPVEFVVDVSDAPEMKDWADKVARLCERNYAMICEELKSDGFKPRTVVTLTMKKDYRGVAATGGGRITGSVSYFKKNEGDVGAMIHETAHVVQAYRGGNNPGWLVEGIADYVRFFKFEPGKIGELNINRARYNGSYRVTAAFLNYVAEKYDSQLVNKLNKAMREGEYKEVIWKSLTKKTVQELDEEWRASLKAK